MIDKTIRILAAIKNLGGENPTSEDILRLAAKMSHNTIDIPRDKSLGDAAQLIDSILSNSLNDTELLYAWDQLELIINEAYARQFLSTDVNPVTLQQVARNLQEITSQVNQEFSRKDIQDAGSRVIGQTLANLAIDINQYVADYSVLDDIISSALSIGSGDGITEDYFFDEWQELVEYIERFNKEVTSKT